MSITQWLPNLVLRIAQLERISQLSSLHHVEVWLGGLFFPEAYITATRQAVAHRKKWSLETLYLQLDVEQIQDPNGFIVDGELESLSALGFSTIQGLTIEGAQWSNSRLNLNAGEPCRLGPSQIRWVQHTERLKLPDIANLPVYLNTDRSDVMFTVELPFVQNEVELVAKRGVCLTASG